MTTNPTNYYYPQYPSALLPATTTTTTTTDNTDLNKLDRDLIYKYERRTNDLGFFIQLEIFFFSLN